MPTAKARSSAGQSRTPDRHLRYILPLLFVAAFAVRLVFLNELQSMPSFDTPKMDELYHLQLAKQINSPAGYPPEAYFRAPLYIYFLAGALKVSADSLYWTRFIQILLASLLPVILFLIGRRLLGYKSALVASLLCAVYPTLLFFDNSLLIESLMPLVTALLCWQLYRLQEKLNWVNAIFAGALLGVAGLLRPNILPLGPALIIWVWIILRPRYGLRRALTSYVLIGVTTALCILPVTIRNYVVGGEFVPIAWQGGFNFYLGSGNDANGWSAANTSIDRSWQGSYEAAIKMAEREEGRPLKPGEVSNYWYDKTFRDIRANPSHFLLLLVKKLRLTFNGEEIPNNYSTYLAREFVPLLRPLLFRSPFFFPYGVLAPLALMGMILLAREWRKYLLIYLIVFAYIGTLLFFFICDRYRQPIIPLLIIFAAGAVVQLLKTLRQKNYLKLGLSGLVLLLLLLESNHSLLGIPADYQRGEDEYGLGCSYLDKGDLEDAQRHFEIAVRANPHHGLAYLNLGYIARQKGNLQVALDYYEDAIKADSTLWQPYLSAAAALKKLGQPEQSLAVLQGARRVLPDNEFVNLELATTYWERGDQDQARKYVTEARRLAPTNQRILQVYNQIFGKQ